MAAADILQQPPPPQLEPCGPADKRGATTWHLEVLEMPERRRQDIKTIGRPPDEIQQVKVTPDDKKEERVCSHCNSTYCTCDCNDDYGICDSVCMCCCNCLSSCCLLFTFKPLPWIGRYSRSKETKETTKTNQGAM